MTKNQKELNYIVMVKITKLLKNHLRDKYEHISELLEFDVLAWQSGFYKIEPKKITATNLIGSFWEMQQLGKNSLSNWGLQMGKNIGQTITKQAVDNRLNADTLVMVKAILKKALNAGNEESSRKKRKKWLKEKKKELQPVLHFFNNIIIHDSTTQQLSSNVALDFPGSYSHGVPTAITRIQAAYNFTQDCWLDMSVGAYTDNDHGQAKALLPELEKRDLLIRDLGYFTLDAISQLIENQFLITRWDNKTSILNREGKKIDLLFFLKKNLGTGHGNSKKPDAIDIPVLIGSKKKIRLRMVARRLPKQKAQQRINKAKKDRHSKTNHSEEYFELLRYEIYLTNIPKTILDDLQIAKMYGLRWYIEIIFKAWKSYYNFKKMFHKTKMNYYRTAITIYLLLIQFVYLTNEICRYIKQKIERPAEGCFISILKFFDVANSCFLEIMAIQNLKQLDYLIPQFHQHATYDIRNGRKNMKEKFQYFNELLI